MLSTSSRHTGHDDADVNIAALVIVFSVKFELKIVIDVEEDIVVVVAILRRERKRAAIIIIVQLAFTCHHDGLVIIVHVVMGSADEALVVGIFIVVARLVSEHFVIREVLALMVVLIMGSWLDFIEMVGVELEGAHLFLLRQMVTVVAEVSISRL